MPKRSMRKRQKKRQVCAVRSYGQKGHTFCLGSSLAEGKDPEARREGQEQLKSLEDLTKDVDAALAELRELTTKAAAKRPLLALAIAFMLGMVFGIALRRPRD